MGAAAIDITHLVKRYGSLTAVDDLSLRVEPGEVFGFLGPNGAGKTSTIRILLGLLSPDAGHAAVLGHDVSQAGAVWRRDVGYLPGELSLWPWLTGAATLAFLASVTDRPATRRDELTERLGLTASALARPVRTYSAGMKQKIGIVQALQCEPRLALLDEPSKGLDPLVQQAFYDILIDLRRRGTSVFLSSHVLPEVEHVCDRVAMLRRGKLVSVGDIEHVRGTLPRRVVVIFGADTEGSSLSSFGRVLAASPRRLEILVSATRIPDLVATLARLPLQDLLIEQPTLEEAFLEQYK
jgi:ABC-2 type transport system ATP-binding protein